jgi:CRP/FNR family transcriptional regulator, dissimilatory nitrate respiration regulator
MRDLESCCLQNSLQRIAQYVYTLGYHCAHKGNHIELPASKAVVASLLNLSPETFSRGLHQLVDAHHISIERRRIYLHNLEALKELASGAIQLA